VGALRAAALVLVVVSATPVRAQITCADTARVVLADFATADRDLGRALQLAGALPATPALLRRASTEHERPVCRDAAGFVPWELQDTALSTWHGLSMLPGTLEMESNSGYRKDRNNGAFRGGVGPSVAVGAGVEFRWKGITAAFTPRLVYESNGDFPTVSVVRPRFSPFMNPHQRPGGYLIDFPQRFGTESDTRMEPGQSYVRFGTRRFQVGASTENFWLGSAQVYPILVSSTAPGFPHVFIGTVEPLDLWIAEVGAHVVVGQLRESDFFDTDTTNDARLFSAAVVEMEPRWIPGLHLGAARIYEEIIPPEGLSFGHYLDSTLNPGLTFASGGNLGGNGMGALLARWVLPAAGFEAYAEWAREDTPYNLRDLLEEPDWTQAYTLGFHQLVTLENAHLRWYGELVHLGESAPVRAGKGFASYYTHNRTIQGHTNDGQILGASPGPGSDAQIFGVDAFHVRGMSGLWLERTRYDDDTYYRRWARIYGESRHDVELGIGVRHTGNVGPVQVSGEILYNHRANRDFLGMEDRTMPRQVDTNLGLRLRAAWRP
jgi:hypothetical protein